MAWQKLLSDRRNNGSPLYRCPKNCGNEGFDQLSNLPVTGFEINLMFEKMACLSCTHIGFIEDFVSADVENTVNKKS